VKRNRRPTDVIILTVLCVLGVLLGRMQTMRRVEGRSDIVTSAVRSMVSPVSTPVGAMSNSLSDFFAGVFSARRLTSENRRLKALADSAALYTDQLTRLNSEIERLRTLQKFGPLPAKTRIPADVIGYSAYENRLTLSAGSRQGVTAGDPVEAPDGLVGVIQSVDTDRSQALLLSSASLTIGALDLSRNPPPAGLLRGENSSTLGLTFQDTKAPVEVGDHIVTSGFSDHIPRGILIGKVISVAADEEFGSLRAKVDPAVSIGQLREVHILR